MTSKMKYDIHLVLIMKIDPNCIPNIYYLWRVPESSYLYLLARIYVVETDTLFFLLIIWVSSGSVWRTIVKKQFRYLQISCQLRERGRRVYLRTCVRACVRVYCSSRLFWSGIIQMLENPERSVWQTSLSSRTLDPGLDSKNEIRNEKRKHFDGIPDTWTVSLTVIQASNPESNGKNIDLDLQSSN